MKSQCSSNNSALNPKPRQWNVIKHLELKTTLNVLFGKKNYNNNKTATKFLHFIFLKQMVARNNVSVLFLPVYRQANVKWHKNRELYSDSSNVISPH